MPQKQYKHRPHFEHLKNTWTEEQKSLQKTLQEKHKDAFEWINHRYKQFMVGSLGSLVMLTHPVTVAVAAQPMVAQHQEAPIEKPAYTKEQLVHDLSYLLPESVQPLTETQEKVVTATLTRHFNLPVTPVLQGKRLNRSYGLIGAEQHLMRYPGDMMGSHFATPQEANAFYSSGMAPGRGAWGYFASSQAAMTEKDVQREKYYIAVQTFLSPGFNENVKDHYEFFKYRKMLVVNPENGKALIADIGDAGPAAWTGKHLGGSPEVMQYLERQDGAAKGPVLYFFIDDPDDTIPLGPIAVQ